MSLKPQASIGGCTAITTSGVHELTQNLTAGATCIVVQADNVVLDGGGHGIAGANVSTDSAGVAIDGASNVTVKNLTVSGWDANTSAGILATNSTAVTVDGVSATNSTNGVLIHQTTNASIRRTSITESSIGLILTGSPKSVVNQVGAFGNDDGIVVLNGADSASLSNLSVVNNTNSGVVVVNSTGSTVENVTGVGNGLGLISFESTETHIADSTWTDNGVGVDISASHNTTVSQVQSHENLNVGVRIGTNASNTAVQSTQAEDNPVGILIENATATTINGSTTALNERGLLVQNGAVDTAVTHHSSQSERQGIRVQNATGLVFDQVSVENASDSGLRAQDSNDVRINGTAVLETPTGFGFENVTDAAISWSGAGYGETGLEMTHSRNVSVAIAEFGHLSERGVSVANSTNVTAEMTAAVNTSIGIEVNNSGSSVLRELYVAETDIGGVLIQESPSVTVERSTVNQSGLTVPDGFGIAILSSVGGAVTNNTVTSASGPGIYLTDTEATGLQENIARNTTVGVFLDGATNGSMLETTAIDNDAAGVALANSSGIDIISSNASANGELGIALLEGTSNVTVADGVTSGNGESGIVVDSANRSVITNATATANGLTGVRVNGSAQETSIEGGIFDSNGAFGISVRNRSTGTVITTASARANGIGALLTNRSGPTTVSALDIGASTAPGTTVSLTGENVSLSPIASAPSHPNRSGIGRYVGVEPTTAHPRVDLDVHYASGDLSGVEESSLELQRFNGSAWSTLQNGSVDTGANVVSGSTDAGGAIAAVGQPSPDPIEYTLALELDGSASALGVPGPLQGTVGDLLPNESGAVTAIFAYENGSWTHLNDLSTGLEARDAIVLVTEDRGEVTMITVPIARNVSTSPRQTRAGWNLVSGHAVSDAETAFGGTATGSSILVLDRFDRANASAYDTVPSFDSYVIGSNTWGASPPSIDPFGGTSCISPQLMNFL
ncbi:MAG: right-handed parallel beta-helix repeat-containing protein [Natrialbaceae archaeon]|nr:right-handed parallel beta-helix repeat-containing protein [Natrialbaceae archaeon]